MGVKIIHQKGNWDVILTMGTNELLLDHCTTSEEAQELKDKIDTEGLIGAIKNMINEASSYNRYIPTHYAD